VSETTPDCYDYVRRTYPQWTTTNEHSGDVVCEHGTAIDVHCCNCHSGFLFDWKNCVCHWPDSEPAADEDGDFCHG
jgi:hypothetical protein